MYYPKIKESYGFANLELKEEFKKPIKKIPLYSKLEKGDYQTASSKSDTNIAYSISSFATTCQALLNIRIKMI